MFLMKILAITLANHVLLKAGLPLLVIEKALLREYIECLADYQVKVGQFASATVHGQIINSLTMLQHTLVDNKINDFIKPFPRF
jgi:hypothetical protein